MIPVYLYKETFAAYALAARRAEMADDFGPYHLLSDNMLEFRSCILCRCRTYARAKKGTRWMPEILVAGAGFEPTASGL